MVASASFLLHKSWRKTRMVWYSQNCMIGQLAVSRVANLISIKLHWSTVPSAFMMLRWGNLYAAPVLLGEWNFLWLWLWSPFKGWADGRVLFLGVAGFVYGVQLQPPKQDRWTSTKCLLYMVQWFGQHQMRDFLRSKLAVVLLVLAICLLVLLWQWLGWACLPCACVCACVCVPLFWCLLLVWLCCWRT